MKIISSVNQGLMSEKANMWDILLNKKWYIPLLLHKNNAVDFHAYCGNSHNTH